MDACWVILQQNSSFYWNEGKARLMSYITLCWLSNTLKCWHGCLSVWTEKQASAYCFPETSYVLSFRWKFAREWTFSNELHSFMVAIHYQKDLPHVKIFNRNFSLLGKCYFKPFHSLKFYLICTLQNCDATVRYISS